MATAPPWKGDASAEEQPRLRALWDLRRPFRGIDQERLTRHSFEPLLPAAAPSTEHLLWTQFQMEAARQADKRRSFGSAAVLVAPVAVSCLAVTHFAAVGAAVVAFAGFVAVSPGAAAADTVAAFVAAAVGFDVAGFGAAVAANVAVVAAAAATESDAVDATVVAAAAVVVGDDGDDEFVAVVAAAAASGVEAAAEFWAAHCRAGSELPCLLEKPSNSQMRTVACWV